MTTPLRPCPACSRHVRVGDPSCPFCGRESDGALPSAPSPLPPMSRLARAAVFVLGAGGFTVSACSNVATSYGSPPCDDACNDVEFPQDAGPDAIADAGGVETSGPEAGCGSPVMTYQCASVPPDAAACVGPTADGGTAYYPLGCVAAAPGCTAATVPASPIECTCMVNIAPAAFGDAQAVFICPD
jgi:hypothetical protein